MEGEFEPFKETSHPPHQSNSTHQWDTEQMMSWPTVVNSDKTNQIILKHFMKTFITWYNLNHQHIDLWSPSCIGTSNSYVLQGLSTLNNLPPWRVSFPLQTPKTSCYGAMARTCSFPKAFILWPVNTLMMSTSVDIHFYPYRDCSVWSIGIRGILSVTGPGWLTLEPREQEAWSQHRAGLAIGLVALCGNLSRSNTEKFHPDSVLMWWNW